MILLFLRKIRWLPRLPTPHNSHNVTHQLQIVIQSEKDVMSLVWPFHLQLLEVGRFTSEPSTKSYHVTCAHACCKLEGERFDNGGAQRLRFEPLTDRLYPKTRQQRCLDAPKATGLLRSTFGGESGAGEMTSSLFSRTRTE